MDWQEFISFRKMVTPIIIKFLFWAGVGVSVLIGLFTILSGIIGGFGEGGFASVAFGLLCGPIFIVVGILSVRIYTELLILAFQIHDSLNDIKNLLEKK